MNNKKTIWQRLSTVVNGEMNPMALEQGGNDLFTPDNSDKDLLVAKSKEELRLKTLEAQQTKYIEDQYTSIVKDRYQKSVFYETTRYSSYIDFEAMEYFPEIAAALDIMSEESTTLHDDGKMLSIRSDSERVKNILEHLFYNILDINSNLPAWTRNTVKYGDNFIHLQSKPKKGIVRVSQLTNIEIKRVEGDPITGDGKTKFLWEVKNAEYSNMEIAHFRLIGDDKKLPYGTSVCEKARKIWKMLSLAEDAMMVYRLSRAPERRVFKIDVGNIDEKDVESYVQRIAGKFKRTSQVNQQNGQIDLRYNVLTQDEDYFIPVRNGQNGTVIDTLQGASNLSEIGDIEFLQNKLFAALRVPKTFLGFGEAAGDGKNLSLQDVRFARTINRIQQAMLQELNKIALIHLFLLGFEGEDLNNFTLALANPSSQAEMLKIEILTAKLDAYIKAVTDAGNGFAPYSMTMAMKFILGLSEDEIIENLRQQRLEKAESLRNSPEVLPTKNLNSGIFDNMDKKFQDNGESNNNSIEGGEEPGGMTDIPAPGGGPNMSGPDMGGGETPIDLPAPEGGNELPNVNESKLIIEESDFMDQIKKNIQDVNQLIG